jgi:phage virion morphogenesis protein
VSDIFKTIVEGDQQFRRVLNNVLQFSKRPRVAMREMAAVLEDETEKNFSAQGRPKWKALSEVTKFNRIGGRKGQKKNGGLTKRSQRVLSQMMILQDSGVMASSVHSQYGDDYSLIGAVGPQARIHQLGGLAGKGHSVKIDARPYLPFTPDLKLQSEAEKPLLKVGMDNLRRAIE